MKIGTAGWTLLTDLAANSVLSDAVNDEHREGVPTPIGSLTLMVCSLPQCVSCRPPMHSLQCRACVRASLTSSIRVGHPWFGVWQMWKAPMADHMIIMHIRHLDFSLPSDVNSLCSPCLQQHRALVLPNRAGSRRGCCCNVGRGSCDAGRMRARGRCFSVVICHLSRRCVRCEQKCSQLMWVEEW